MIGLPFVVSLYEMIEFFAADFHEAMLVVRALLWEMQQGTETKGPAAELSEPERKQVRRAAARVRELCKDIGLDNLAYRADETCARVDWSPTVTSCNYQLVEGDLERLLVAIGTELKSHRFALIPPENQQYFEKADPLGLGLPSPLPTTDQDIREAANALAIGLYAATAFYLLRVAELAVREFYAAKGITIPARPNLEDTDWSELIQHLDGWLGAQIVQLGTPKRGSPEGKRIDSYNALIADARFLKTERNKTMHPRHVWNRPEAENLFSRVRDFVQRIAELL